MMWWPVNSAMRAIIMTHNAWAVAYADRSVRLLDGRVVEVDV